MVVLQIAGWGSAKPTKKKYETLLQLIMLRVNESAAWSEVRFFHILEQLMTVYCKLVSVQQCPSAYSPCRIAGEAYTRVIV